MPRQTKGQKEGQKDGHKMFRRTFPANAGDPKNSFVPSSCLN